MVLRSLKFNLGTSFKAKFLWTIVPFIILANIISGISFGFMSAHQLRTHLVNSHTNIAKARANVLAAPLWEFELERAQKLLNELVLNNDVVRAEIKSNGEHLIATSNNGENSNYHSREVMFPIIYKAIFQDKEIGRLTVVFSTKRVTDLLIYKILESLFISSILAVLISLYIFRVAQMQVIKPLTMLTDTITRSSEDNKRYHVPWNSRDEFGQVVSNFNQMQTSLDREEEKLRRVNQKLDYIAYNDGLTGLPNRACCLLDMKRWFKPENADEQFALIHLDLDNFKHVNDALGHHAGDHLLVTVGHRLSLIIDSYKNSKAYRWGGDEFILIFDMQYGKLENFCSELTDLINVPLPHENTIIRPSVSIGAAIFPDDGDNFSDLMISSDLALYKSKETGRDNYCFFTKEFKEEAEQNRIIEEDFRKALDADDQLYMAFQPQLNSTTFQVTGLEALIRWNHPEKGNIPPNIFLPVTEESNLAQELGRFVYDQSCKAARSWLDDNITFGTVAINLSAKHIKLETALPDFYTALKRYDLDTKYITAEVTESLFLGEGDIGSRKLIDNLHANGVRIELDDFGTGFAALSHLSTLPIDGLKIDRSFTQSMLEDKKKAIIIKSLFDMTKLLKIDLICEGVETKEQLSKLQILGRSSIQGYYTAKPMPFEEITTWLRAKENFKFIPMHSPEAAIDIRQA